ncbi:tripartite tricarboxylate transporter substrate-binding protein [Limnohabitans sp.]|uniref:tripartite tricarboxylate transporter substrate-binding protein n=1 Tax=Limnohabitans sp. TaxID=1907725 RepID=UPI00286EFC02|nr:hypothetical protein [Limnohabitans sp.]
MPNISLRQIKQRQVLQALASATVSAFDVALARSADPFSSKSITPTAPWPAGGGSDAVMRAFAESASRILGVPVIGENKPGADGTLGATAMVNAKPDG